MKRPAEHVWICLGLFAVCVAGAIAASALHQREGSTALAIAAVITFVLTV